MCENVKRLLRYVFGRCVVCGKHSNWRKRRYVYCSIECACYDGTFSVVKGWVKPVRVWK